MCKRQVTACARTPDGDGGRREVVREFATFTGDLEALAGWLAGQGVTTVAMEATGSYWKPLWQVLEDAGFELLLANARHVKQVPGRKTDVADAVWLCRLLEAGLLSGSFVPPPVIRQLRDLTRYRTRLIQDRTREIQRVEKVLEDAAIKLGAAPRVVGRDLSRPPRVAGTRRSGRTRNGDTWLVSALVQAAWAAARSRDTYLHAQVWRLAARRGKKRAAVAVAHSILVAVWHMLTNDVDHHDLGGDFFTQPDTARRTRHHIRQLEALGYQVTLEQAA